MQTRTHEIERASKSRREKGLTRANHDEGDVSQAGARAAAEPVGVGAQHCSASAASTVKGQRSTVPVYRRANLGSLMFGLLAAGANQSSQ